MTSPVRPLLASLLCCVIALGHSPAWLHVATCGCTHVDAAVSLATSPGSTRHDHCSHCCGHVENGHVESGPTENAPTENGGVASHDGDQPVAIVSVSSSPAHEHGHGHDSEACAICHSLASSCGVPWQLDVMSVSQAVCHFVLARHQEPFLPRLSASAHPRGPPAIR
ncbi:hypothetical protein Q31b_13770 [Novipirellula aureliae]|uniref:Uncharacterized protein n=1 Tax=Novipirellula aureliae TaxID=2527966 RepID=A0A5C6E580_9BACT|nr:hypothetical protein [Novipirellula aureliae]TWU43845.1 hypothetical protein Q31b_13770 [Novipirellula aureliae]